MRRQFQRLGHGLLRRAGVRVLDAPGGVHRSRQDLDLDLREVMDAALHVEEVDAGGDAAKDEGPFGEGVRRVRRSVVQSYPGGVERLGGIG